MKRTALFFLITLTLLALATIPAAKMEGPTTLGTTSNTTALAMLKAAPFAPPTVTLTSPLNNAQFLAGATIRLSADATDSDGTISKVEFFQGATKLGEDTSSPYSFDWTNVAAGSYALTARATDNQSEVTTSSAVNISVLGQARQYAGWSTITNGTDLGNGTVRKTSAGTWDFVAVAAQTLQPGDGYFESTAAAGGSQSISLDAPDGQSRYIIVGTGTWVGIYENNVEVAATCCRAPNETIPVHAAGDRYRLEISNGKLLYVKYRAGARTVMFTSNAALPVYPFSFSLHSSPQNAEWQNSVIAQLNRKAAWSTISNGIDLGNGTVRKTSTGSWDFVAIAAQQAVAGDSYFESTAASGASQSISLDAPEGQSRYILVGTGSWVGIYENGAEVAATCCRAPNETIPVHAAGDRYRLEISNGKLFYVKYRAGVRTLMFTSNAALPPYPYTFSVHSSLQNAEWQNSVVAQQSRNATWSSITNGIDLGNGSLRKTSTGTWDFSAGARQQLVSGSGYFESTASYYNQSMNLIAPDGQYRYILVGTGSWASLNENGVEIASTCCRAPSETIAPHIPGDRYRMEISRGKLRYVRYRSGVRSVMFTSPSALPPYPFSFTFAMSFQNSEWQNTIFSDNVPEHNDAAFVSQTVPTTMTPGQTYNVSVTMRNTGASTWTPDGDYQLGSENLSDNTRWGMSRVNLTSIVPPGADATFNFTVTAPAPGSHSFQWRMVQQDVQRFGALTTNVNVQTVNNPPTVNLTGPAQNATFTAPATVPFAATATDSDGTITKVEFFQGSTKVGEDTTSPYTFDWTSVAAGNYVLSAKATDNGGATTMSSTVNITVNAPNQLPAVNLTFPTTNGQVFSAPANLTLAANATDADGIVTKVQFFRGGATLIGEDTSAPFTFDWNNVAAGNYSLTAKAFDNAGATTTSAPIAITVNALPSVSLTLPANGQVFTAPANITLTATPTDSDGSITKVQFFQGATLLNEDTSSPYSFNWNNVPAGNYSLTAKAFDNLGGNTTSSAVNAVVTNAPTTSITSPSNNAPIAAGSNLTISANASDDGSVLKVEFFKDGVLLGEDTTSPYSFTWTNVPAGTYSLTTRATDNLGITGTSSAVTVNVVVSSLVSRLDPQNRTGGGGENPLSRNYNWSVPLLNLPGRAGLDLGLSLSYNSLVWIKTGSYVTFNDDAGFPSPGFRLGFPVIQGQFFNSEANKNAYLLITPDGSRIELRQIATNSTLYESVDSSHLLLDSTTMMLRTTDGTRLSYVSYGGEFKCIQIMDANGNFLTVTYLSDGRINTVVDTLGRTITFNYNATDFTLTSITQSWGGTTHVWASFTYTDTTVQTGFINVTNLGPANGNTVKTLRSVTLNDGSRFEFDHTGWIQVSKINHYAADGHLLNYRSYNLPPNGATQLDDCPRFTERGDLAENFNRGGSPGTSGLPSGPEEEVLSGVWTNTSNASWTLPDGTNESGVMVQVTLADGTYNKIYFANTAGWKRGLPSKVDTYGKTTPDQPTAIIQRRRANMWTQDDENVAFLLNPRVKETHVYDFDGSGQIKNHARTRTTFVSVNYGNGTSCNLPQDVFEYQANATTVLRRTRTDYITPAGVYLTAHVVGLPSESKMYEINPSTGVETLMTRVAFAYDEAGSIVGTDAPIQHDNTAYNASFLVGRGNLSSVTRYDVVTGASSVARAKYNTAGSVRTTIDPVGHQVNIGYADSFSDGNNNRNTLAYPTSVTDPDSFVTTSQYNFDHGRIKRSQTPPPAGYAVGPIKKFTYDWQARLTQVTIELDGNADYSHTRFVYPDSQNRVDTYSTIEAGQGEALSFSLLDGHGRSFAAVSANPGSSGLYAAKLTLFDKLGRTIKESNPTETDISGSYLNWAATGDDNTGNGGAGWVYTSQTYDWNDRPLIVTNPDGSTKSASYDGCGCAGGDTVTLTSEGTAADGTTKRRQEKIYRDVLGRITKTEAYNWDGTGPNGTGGSIYSTTVNSYNARDQLTRTRKFQGSPADPDAANCLSESLRLGTDSTWKQTQTYTAGWWNLGFDDSAWTNSVDEGAYNTSPWGAGGMPSDTPARWIWYYDSRVGTGDSSLVYFRKQFVATSTSATLTLRMDNIFVAYLNGVQIAEGNQWQLTNTINLTLTPGSTYVLGVEVLNQGGPGGLIADLKSIGTTCEQETRTYDGYGRLKTKHVPGQDLNGVTTYNYDDDDTLTSIIDARGATTTLSYANNSRHLVTGISYIVPGGSGIADPSDIIYGYDGAGNRTSMSDGMGTMSYQYDQLSRLTSETRNFVDPNSPFLNASYALNYQYNLANQPKKITDHTNTTINYNYDQVGHLTGVTGENNLYGGVSTYASAATYRAWGALKGVTYGNNYTTAFKYNARLQGTELEVSGRPAEFGSSTVMKSQLSYYDDATLKFAHDTLDERFDRAYSYDNVGRLKEAYTGSEARDYRDGTNSGPATGPYRQSYQYDVYDHITQRTNRFWSQFDSLNASYANNRRQDAAFQYDADGRLTKDSDLNYTYDAAGRNVTTFDFVGSGGRTETLSYNGDGLLLKKHAIESGVTTITYYVRSSVLGGRVVTELDGQGIKQKGYVYVGMQAIARQENNAVVWQHVNPLTGTSGESTANGSYTITNEPDPMGVNVGTEDPFSQLIMENFEPSPVMPMMYSLFDDSSGCGSNPNCTRCYLDGFEIGCGRAAELLDRGAAQFDTIATVRVTYTSGRTETFVGHTSLPPGMDVRFTGGLAQAAWFGFRMGNIWGGFDTGVQWALANAVIAQQNTAGGDSIGRMFGGFVSFFVPLQQGQGQQSPTPNKDKEIAGAVALARGILSTKNPCSDFFGPNAIKALNAFEQILRRGYTSGPGDTTTGIEQSGPQTTHGAPTEYRTFQSAVANNSGPFFNPVTKSRPGNYNPASNQSQVLQLLHELAHLVYDNGAPLIPDDAGPTKKAESEDNTEEVLKHCKTEIDQIKN